MTLDLSHLRKRQDFRELFSEVDFMVGDNMEMEEEYSSQILYCCSKRKQDSFAQMFLTRSDSKCLPSPGCSGSAWSSVGAGGE